MIIVRFTSGLGNQMFQYAFYQLMKQQYPETKVRADLTWFHANNDHHGYELERIFAGVEGSDFNLEQATTVELMKVTGIIPCFMRGKWGSAFDKFRRYPNRLIRIFTEKKRQLYKIDELQECFTAEEMNTAVHALYQKVMKLDTSKDWYLSGFWTEEAYYKDRLEQGVLQKELVFPKLTGRNAELATDIAIYNAVSIHVRRGDYLTKYASDFIALGREYYEKAVTYIEQQVESPVYYIFSDDSTFAEEEFTWIANKVIVSHNTGEESYRDMQLMSLCKHNIIANSTFSQWSAFLNQNSGHITVYPKQYMHQKDNEKKSLANWIML